MTDSPWKKGYKVAKSDEDITADHATALVLWFQQQGIPPNRAMAAMATAVAFILSIKPDEEDREEVYETFDSLARHLSQLPER